MNAEMLTTRINPAETGEFITENFYLELVQSFRAKFPTEERFVMLSRAAIETILNDSNVSGIKFMNALENANDPASRMLILVPGNYTSHGSLPNSIIKKAGFITNSGNSISLEKTWDVLFNHVLNYKKLDAEMHYTKINRGSFFGRAILTALLNATDENNFIFHFGYLAEEGFPYKPIIQPADGMKMFADMSSPCPGPPNCPGSSGDQGCITTSLAGKFAGTAGENQLAVLRTFRDSLLQNKINGAAIEKYYTISTSLMEAINNHQNKEAIFKELYEKYLKASVAHLNQNDEASAYELFIEVIDHLSDQYLFQ